jgi:phosphohistidine swiveling domain-containing protein
MLESGKPKWTLSEDTAGGVLAGLTREAVATRVAANVNRLDVPWGDAVNARWSEIFSAEDGATIADDVFAELMRSEGRKFYAGAEVSVFDRPDLYILRSDQEADLDPSEFPPGSVGDGDNVFRTEDVSGTVLVVRRVADVDALIIDGVPEGTIGVIDDAGGTMTAPILPDFEGVVCLAGTVRSHLGILAREFGVPTLMAARLSRPLRNGERITVEYSAEPQDVSAYLEEDRKPRASIRVLDGGEHP